MLEVADAMRRVTIPIHKEIAAGRRSTRIDAEDVVQILLSIADQLDPPFGDPADPGAPEEN